MNTKKTTLLKALTMMAIIAIFIIHGENISCTDISQSVYFYQQLTPAEKMIYGAILDAGNEKIDFEEPVTQDEFDNAYWSAVYDYPEIRGEEYVLYRLKDDRNSIKGFSFRNRDKAKDDAVRNAANINTTSPTMAGTVLEIHDQFMQSITYTKAGENIHKPEGALISHAAACDGISYAFQIACRQKGIPCITLYGKNQGAHAWNVVMLDDGQWYEIDASYDIANNCHDMFLVTTQQMSTYNARGLTGAYGNFIKMGTRTWDIPIAYGVSYSYDSLAGLAKGNVFESGGIQYEITENKEVTVIGGNNSASLNIPGKVNYRGECFTVTKIAQCAFKNNRKIKSLTIGENINCIGDKAFYGCKKIKKITVRGEKINEINKNSFKKCNVKILKIKKGSNKYKKKIKKIIILS